jgi:CubicO group peptidase (beta-lactamase class C family)
MDGRPRGGMIEPMEELQRTLEQLIAEHNVPGAQAAVWTGETLVEAAAGVLSTRTRLAVTTDSVFQIGSVSKVFTAMLAVQLAEEGRIDLDEPIVKVLTDFTLADEGADEITMRHLLAHTSGIDAGDLIDDFGPGDDAAERYVANLANVGLVHPPGRYASYCNGGYVVAGRAIEVLTGGTWHRAVTERILIPAGMRDSVVSPEEALLRPASVGHRVGADGELKIASPWRLPHCLAAAGSDLCTSAGDLARFGLVHLRGGVGENDVRLLSAAGVASMQAVVATQSQGEGRGLGWNLSPQRGHPAVWHGGTTLGQNALLTLLVDDGLVVATTTNSWTGGEVSSGILAWALDRYRGSVERSVADIPRPRRVEVDPERFVGLYRRAGVDLQIARAGDALAMSMTNTGSLSDVLSAGPLITLVPIGEFTLAPIDPDGQPYATRIEFLEPDDDGRPRYVWAGHIARRVAEST